MSKRFLKKYELQQTTHELNLEGRPQRRAQLHLLAEICGTSFEPSPTSPDFNTPLPDDTLEASDCKHSSHACNGIFADFRPSQDGCARSAARKTFFRVIRRGPAFRQHVACVVAIGEVFGLRRVQPLGDGGAYCVVRPD